MKLAIFGGKPVRKKEFDSKIYINKKTLKNVNDLLKKNTISGFVGSPVKGQDAAKIFKLNSVSVTKKIDQSRTIMGGEQVLKFEKNLSKIYKVKYCITFNSATSAIQAALMSLNLNPGDNVITTPWSFTASYGAIIAANLKPLFCDIDLNTFCIDPKLILKKDLNEAKAIMHVSWNSNAGDLGELKRIAIKNKIGLIEDSSQSIFNKYENKYIGTIGQAGVLSLNQPKNFSCGEGGVIITNNAEVASKVRKIRNHGEAFDEYSSKDDDLINNIGFNFRLSDLHAVILDEQLKKRNMLNSYRKKNYLYLKKELSKFFGDFLQFQKITNSEYIPYTLGLRYKENVLKISKEVFVKALTLEGIPVSPGLPRLLSEHPSFKKKITWGKGRNILNNFKFRKLKNSEILFKEYLGFFQLGYPYTISDMYDIVVAIKKIVRFKKELQNYKF